ncbi:response regulator [Paenibacillus donghaensis]|nr:response regulator [Paenibacillus donghaensis]
MEEHKQTVLYVEDNPLNMELMHHIFRKNLPAVQLLKAETAESGLQIAEQQQPDLIILDIGLPDLDGYEAMEYLKKDQRTCHIPVLAISAFAQQADIQRAEQVGFAGYVTKPIQVKAFTRTVEQLLGG